MNSERTVTRILKIIWAKLKFDREDNISSIGRENKDQNISVD